MSLATDAMSNNGMPWRGKICILLMARKKLYTLQHTCVYIFKYIQRQSGAPQQAVALATIVDMAQKNICIFRHVCIFVKIYT